MQSSSDRDRGPVERAERRQCARRLRQTIVTECVSVFCGASDLIAGSVLVERRSA